MPTLALIDYGAGNLHSVRMALQSLCPEIDIGVGADADIVAAADRIVFPGVGHFATCMAALRRADGLIEAMSEAVLRRGTPYLGICVGMQVLADIGREGGDTAGLAWIPGEVTELAPDRGVRVPHMGWNLLRSADHPLSSGLGDEPHMYFAHSCVFRPRHEADTLAHCTHGETFAATLARDNICATQFHPEKSQRTGLRLLANFLGWKP